MKRLKSSFIDLHRITSGFHWAMQRMWHDSRERLPFRTPVPSPFLGLAYMLQLWRLDSSNLPFLYSTFHLGYSLVLSRFCFVPTLWPWYRPRPFSASQEVSMEHLHRVWHARERLPSPTPGQIPFGNFICSNDFRHFFQWLQWFSTLFHFEYPLP